MCLNGSDTELVPWPGQPLPRWTAPERPLLPLEHTLKATPQPHPIQMRKPLHDCPLCAGEGIIRWHLYTNVGGMEWMKVGSIVNEDGRRSPHMVEKPESKLRRAAWMAAETGSFNGACPCTFWRKTWDFNRKLFQLAAHMVRVKQNKPIPESDLNDDLDGI